MCNTEEHTTVEKNINLEIVLCSVIYLDNEQNINSYEC